MEDIEARLRELGLKLPEVAPPIANYVQAVRVGSLIFLAGHLPWRDGAVRYRGRLGADLDLSTGREAARLVMLNCLATLKAELGDLNRVRRIVKLLAMVNSAPGFEQQPEVANGASDLLTAVFGERGKHARSAVGMAGLPRGACIEIEMIVEVA